MPWTDDGVVLTNIIKHISLSTAQVNGDCSSDLPGKMPGSTFLPTKFHKYLRLSFPSCDTGQTFFPRFPPVR